MQSVTMSAGMPRWHQYALSTIGHARKRQSVPYRHPKASMLVHLLSLSIIPQDEGIDSTDVGREGSGTIRGVLLSRLLSC
jgi:hypothetical protein